MAGRVPRDVAPRFVTPRTEAKTLGGRVDQVAKAMGTPLQTWQRLAADIGSEVTADGEWVFPDVVVTVPRQAGKSTLLGPKNLRQMLAKPNSRCWLTAQTRAVASDLVTVELGGRVARSALASHVRLRKAIGSEGLYGVNGSTLRPFPPDITGLHGQRSDQADTDEVWAQGDGVELEQAIRPTLTTTGGQTWWVSTAGTATSTLLRRLVERGRAGAPGVCLIEYAAPDDVAEEIEALLHAGRPEDISRAVDLTLMYHPGEFVRRPAVLAAASSMSPSEYLRAFCNRWTETSDGLVAANLWQACRADGDWPRWDGRIALGLAAEPDRSRTVVAAAWRSRGKVFVDLVDARPGTSWAAERVTELRKSTNAVAVGVDSGDPAGAVADTAVTHHGLAKHRLHSLTARDYAKACAQVLELVNVRGIVHPGTKDLDEAVLAASARPLSDLWVWDRRAGAVAPLVAATVALWALDHTKAGAKPSLHAVTA